MGAASSTGLNAAIKNSTDEELQIAYKGLPDEKKKLVADLLRSMQSGRVFAPAEAKGGCSIDPKTTALVCIEYQNEFTTDGGKLYPAVKEVMEATEMLSKSANVAKACRDKGAKVMHAAIMFKEDASDNPNKGLGILAGCANDKLFIAGSWNADYCDTMKPEAGDMIVEGKRGLDAFPGSNLEDLLKANNIETVALCGFLTNCCVESTMRTAYEKGFNVVTLTDCCATTSVDGQKCATEGTFGMFSKPMIASDFIAELK
jgi:nicotinamidase-related amidase